MNATSYEKAGGVNLWTLLGAVKNRPKFFTFTLLLLMTLSVVAVKTFYQPQYEARALVKLQSESLIPTTLSDPRRAPDASVLVKEEILNRVVLEKVIAELNLDEPSEDPSAIQAVLNAIGIESSKRKRNIDAIVRTLRANIGVMEAGPASSSHRRVTSSDVFLITLQGDNPEKISEIINTIILTYLNEKKDSNVLEAKQALDFLELRVEEVGKNLMVANKKLDIFKSQYANTLSLGPMLASSYQTAKMNLFRAQGELAEARSQVREAKTALSTEPQYLVPDVTLEEIDSGEALALDPQEMLPRLRNQLARYETKYTSEHPDIVHTRREIERLEKQIESGVATNNSSVRTRGYVNPEWQRLRADHSSALSAVRAAQSEVGEYRREVATLEKAMQESPKVTEHLDSLTRIRDNLERTYTELKDQLSRARLAYEASLSNVGSKMRVIEPAVAPETPVGASSLILQIGGMFMAGILALGLTMVTNMYGPKNQENSDDSLVFNIIYYFAGSVWFLILLGTVAFEFVSQSLVIQ